MWRLSEDGVYKNVAFISKIEIEEIEILCQFKIVRYFLYDLM